MGLVGGEAESGFAVGFIGLVVAFEEADIGVGFEGEDVGGDAVEEPAVVADDDGAAGEVFEGFFESSHGVDVEVVGGFVEEDDVGALFEDAGEVYAVAFAAGEEADGFLLVCAGETEA